jgi:hypothetical protein
MSMDFSDALRQLKAGQRVARAGWNGKGMWICLGKGLDANPAQNFWNTHTREHAEQNGGFAKVLPYIIMKTADDAILMGWLASQSDVLADDWELVQ